jgi:peptide/nickel transport system substrate-binding protein
VLEILAEELTAAVEENYIPYEATLGQFVSADEAAERYSNLQEWYRRRGHFWIGTGPMFLQRAFPVEGNVILTRNPDFPDQSGRWDALAGAPLPQVDVEGPTRVTIGDEAVFEIFVDTPAGEPYAVADIGSAQYLLFDAEGNLVATGEAENVGEGLYEVVLSSDVTGDLVAGSNRLELVVVSNLVALPSSAGVEFVTAP